MKDKLNISLPSIVIEAGVQLRRAGARFTGLCPFHTEKTNSFFIFPDQHYHCFGCGEHGDVIDFVQKFYGLSFKDALKHLNIKQGPVTPQVKREIEQRKRKAELLREFRQWEETYCGYVSDMYRNTKQLMMKLEIEDFELIAPLYHQLPVWEYHRDILINGSDELRYKLYKQKRPSWKKRIST